MEWIRSSMDGNYQLQKQGYWPWLKHESETKMKVADDKRLLVWFQCVKSGPHGCALAKYERASRALEPVNRIRPMSFQHATGVWACGNLHPCPKCVLIKPPTRRGPLDSPSPPPPQMGTWFHHSLLDGYLISPPARRCHLISPPILRQPSDFTIHS